MEVENYEHLEGKEIISKVGGHSEMKCLVVGCDRDVGISIVLNEDIPETRKLSGAIKGEEHMCHHGKSSPFRKSYEEAYPHYAEEYDWIFDILIKELEEGVMVTDISEISADFGGFGADISCAFL